MVTTKKVLQGTRVGLARIETETTGNEEDETARETDTGTEVGTGKSIGAGAGVESVRRFIRLTSLGKILVQERFIQQTSHRREVGVAAVIKRTKNATNTKGGGRGHVTGTAAGKRGEEATMPTS